MSNGPLTRPTYARIDILELNAHELSETHRSRDLSQFSIKLTKIRKLKDSNTCKNCIAEFDVQARRRRFLGPDRKDGEKENERGRDQGVGERMICGMSPAT
jgi:hypothetical protein